MSEETIHFIRESLAQTGGVTLEGPEGKSLFLVLNRNLGIERHGILIAYEGGGACFFDLDRPLNEFRLVQHGFSLRVAPTLAKMVNAILSSEGSAEEPVNALLPLKQLTTLKDL